MAERSILNKGYATRLANKSERNNLAATSSFKTETILWYESRTYIRTVPERNIQIKTFDAFPSEGLLNQTIISMQHVQDSGQDTAILFRPPSMDLAYV